MSHGPPLSANLYGFETLAVGPDLSTPQMTSDPNDMMSLMDGNLYGYDGGHMSLNLDPNVSMAHFQSSPATLPVGSSADQPFSPDETVTGLTSVTSLSPGASLANNGGAGDGATSAANGNGNGHSTVNASNTANANNGPAGNNAPTSTSTLTDFTKRRDWPAKVVEQLQDWLHIIDSHGRIKHVSPSVERLTGYKPHELIDTFIQTLIHPDDQGVFAAELNESVAAGTPLRLFYRFKKKVSETQTRYVIFEAVGHAHIAEARFAPTPDNKTAFCQAVFMMARAYPTANIALLNSFLEHKMENERLKRKIAELRKEEQEEADESARTWRQSQEGRSDITASEDAMRSGATSTPIAAYQFGSAGQEGSTANALGSMAPPERPPPLNIALTRENLEGIAGGRPDSIREKMARYENSTHAQTIEMFTGLRYQEGERSRGITAGNTSPTLIKGDAGIAIPMDRDPRMGEKKKKQKVSEEYVCTDCGTLDSPEWRKGPNGPKTLCNACGLRWAKKEKKMKNSNAHGGGGDSQQPLSALD